jgi:hypothetical protein
MKLPWDTHPDQDIPPPPLSIDVSTYHLPDPHAPRSILKRDLDEEGTGDVGSKRRQMGLQRSTRHAKPANSYCRDCRRMLAISFEFESSPRRIDQASYCRTDVSSLKTSTEHCSMCDLIFSILRGPRGFVRIEAHTNESVDNQSFYNSDGLTDIEAMTNRRKARAELSISLTPSRYSGNAIDELELTIRRIRRLKGVFCSVDFEIKERLVAFDLVGMFFTTVLHVELTL